MILSRYLLFFFSFALNFILLPDKKTDTFTQQALLNTYTNARKYNEVCWLTSHNAFANAMDGWIFCQQYLDLDGQYAFGVRSFMVDLHWYEPNPQEKPYIALCHEPRKRHDFACPYSAAATAFKKPLAFKDLLYKIKGWLEADEKEIITLHLENRLGTPEGPAAIRSLLEEVGLIDYLFHKNEFKKVHTGPIKIYEWPTLGEMRNTKRRLVIFSDEKKDRMISVASHRETEYNLSQYEKCELRTDGRGQENEPLFILNHFHMWTSGNAVVCNLRENIKKAIRFFANINSYDKIMNRVDECRQQERILPNFIAVDFVEIGDQGGARRVVTELNERLFPNFNLDENLKEISDEHALKDEL